MNSIEKKSKNEKLSVCLKDNQKPLATKAKNKLKKLRGIFIGLNSAFCLALSSILNKKATFVTGSEQMIARYIMQLMFMLALAFNNKLNIFGPKHQRSNLIFCGICLATAGLTLSLSVKYIDPSDTEALHSTRLIMIVVLARLILKEKMTIIHVICFILTIIGVLFVTQPLFLVENFLRFKNYKNETNKMAQNTMNSYLGISFGIICACSASLIAILVKKLTVAKVHYSLSMLYACYIGLPLSIAISIGMYFANWRNVNPEVYDTNEKFYWQIFYMFCSALFGCLFQALSVVSNRYETASKLAIVSTTNLFWSFMLQYVVLDIETNLFSAIGALLIIFSVIMSILVKIGDEQNLKTNSLKENETKFNILKKCLLFKF